jgi:hypothetical protein
MQNRNSRGVAATGKRCALLAGFFAGLIQAACASPVAIVTDLAGTTTPNLSNHQEVAAGTKIALAPGARISLLHYVSCSIVTLKAGTAMVTADGIETNAANVDSTTPGPCPRVHRIAHQGPGPLGGVVVTRGAPMPPIDIAADSSIVLSGDGFADVSSAEVIDGNAIAQRVPVQGRSLQLDGALPVKRGYLLRISFKGRGDTVEVPFSISTGSAGRFVLLQLD